MLHPTVLRLAMHYHREGQAAQAAYDRDVADWYRSGPGRAPKWRIFVEGDEVYRANVGGDGHAFPYCVHGSSLWTDYDNICWGCEEGIRLDDPALALQRAKSVWNEATRRRVDVLLPVVLESTVPQEIKDALTDWVVSALPTIPERPARRLP